MTSGQPPAPLPETPLSPPAEPQGDDLEHPRPLSPDTLSRGFRWPTEAERHALLRHLSDLPDAPPPPSD